jgi:hypothetical protein
MPLFAPPGGCDQLGLEPAGQQSCLNDCAADVFEYRRLIEGSEAGSSSGTEIAPSTTSSISGSATVSGFADAAAFTTSHKTAFAKAVADTLGGGVTHTQVTVTVADARRRKRSRRLADLAVSYTVTGLNATQATTAAATLDAVTPAAFVATLTEKMTAEEAVVPADLSISSIAATVLDERSGESDSTPHLRIGTVVSPPFMLLDSDTNMLSGYLLEMLGHMMERNFSRLEAGVRTTGGHFGKLNSADVIFDFSLSIAGDTHDEALTKLYGDDAAYDLILADVHVTPERTRVIDFSPAWQFTGLVPIRYASNKCWYPSDMRLIRAGTRSQ